MSHQSIITFLMLGMALADYEKAITQNDFVIRSGQEGCWNIDKDRNRSITHVRECLASVKDQCDESGPEIPRKVGGNCVASEAPNHVAVGEAYNERCRSWGDKRLQGTMSAIVCSLRIHPDRWGVKGTERKPLTFAGSKQDQITIAMNESTKNSVMTTQPRFV